MFEHSTYAFLVQCSYRLSYRAVLLWLLLSDYYYQITIILDLIEILIQNTTSSSWEAVIGSQIRISIRIAPNFELGLPMIITSLLTEFNQNPTSSLWEILLTNKQTKNRQTHEGDCNIPLFAG